MHKRLFTPHQFGSYTRRPRPVETATDRWTVISGNDVRAHLVENRSVVDRGFEDEPSLRQPRLVLAECLRRLELDVDSTESKIYRTSCGPAIAIALRGDPGWFAIFLLDEKCAAYCA